MTVGQPPLEAAPTPQGYAQRKAMGRGQGQNQGPGSNEGAGQGHGQGQSLMDASRPRNADVETGADDAAGLSDQQPMAPPQMSQVRCENQVVGGD